MRQLISPNYDVVLMITLLVHQQWYGLADPEFERQVIVTGTKHSVSRRRIGCPLWTKEHRFLGYLLEGGIPSTRR